MARKYAIRSQEHFHFVTFTVVHWIDVFKRNEYKDIFIESVKFCQREKGLLVGAWCIMTSHIHMAIGTNGQNKLEDIIRDMKSYTSRHIRKYMQFNPQESRKEWMLWMMERAGKKLSNNNDFEFWLQHNHPIELSNSDILQQRLDYIHNNPVVAGFVDEPEYWKYSSAIDYSGGKGIIELSFLN